MILGIWIDLLDIQDFGWWLKGLYTGAYLRSECEFIGLIAILNRLYLNSIIWILTRFQSFSTRFYLDSISIGF